MKTRRIFLTGGAGFLGSRILKQLLDRNFYVYILEVDGANLDRIKNYDNSKFEIISLSTENNIKYFFKNNKINYILHTATCFGRNGESDDQIFNTNQAMPLLLFQYGAVNGVDAFINADTFFTENLVFEGREAVYVKTKKEFVRMARSFNISKTKFVNLIIYHMYGEADGNQKFIPTMIRKISAGQKNIEMTPGLQTRDFIYVDDVARAFLAAINNFDKFGSFENFEIGTGREVSIKDIVMYLNVISGSKASFLWGSLKYRENEIMRSCANLAQNFLLNWNHSVEYEDGMKKTLDYYKYI